MVVLRRKREMLLLGFTLKHSIISSGGGMNPGLLLAVTSSMKTEYPSTLLQTSVVSWLSYGKSHIFQRVTL